MDAAEHADHTGGVGNGAVSREDRGGDGTKSDLVFAVFNRVAGFPAFGKLLQKRRDVRDGVRRKGDKRLPLQKLPRLIKGELDVILTLPLVLPPTLTGYLLLHVLDPNRLWKSLPFFPGV